MRMNAQTAPAMGGKGGAPPAAALPISPTSRSDLRTVAMGLRQGWEFPETFHRLLPNALLEIVAKRDPTGKIYVHTPRERIAASRVLALMHGQNQKETAAPSAPQLHLHEHRHTLTCEDRRRTYLARLDRPGDGG